MSTDVNDNFVPDEELENDLIEYFVENVARVAHEVNKAYCEALGDSSQVPWSEAPEWQKNSAIDGVFYLMENPEATPESSHENWLKLKESEGWKWGPIKDVEKKEHPCFLPYDQLPLEQRVKDYLFRSVVKSLTEV